MMLKNQIQRRLCKDRNCIIHCTDNRTDLDTLKDEESWKTLLKAAEIRQHQALLELAKSLSEGEIPTVYYHRKCRSVFTMKKLLDKISHKTASDHDNQELTAARRLSNRCSPTTSTTYERLCIFC